MTTHQLPDDFMSALRTFASSAVDVLTAWESANYLEISAAVAEVGYPFDESFDEIALRIANLYGALSNGEGECLHLNVERDVYDDRVVRYCKDCATNLGEPVES